MRRCHSEAMQDYRRQNNEEMWERFGRLLPVGQDDWPNEKQRNLALWNLESRLLQAVKLYIEETEVGE